MRGFKRGFTIIELLIIVSIIALLATLVFINVQKSQAKSRDSKRIADLGAIKSALAMYYDENKKYPISNEKTGVDLVDCDIDVSRVDGGVYTGKGADCLSNNENFKNYINPIPLDPQNPSRYYYYWPRRVVYTTSIVKGANYTLVSRCETTCLDGFKWGWANTAFGGRDKYYALTSSTK